MPITRYNPKPPRRGFYDQRFSTRQVRLLEKMADDMQAEIHILRMQVLILLGQIEGLGYYTDIDLGKLAMIDRLINTISRLVRRDRKKFGAPADIETMLEDLLGESEPWEGE